MTARLARPSSAHGPDAGTFVGWFSGFLFQFVPFLGPRPIRQAQCLLKLSDFQRYPLHLKPFFEIQLAQISTQFLISRDVLFKIGIKFGAHCVSLLSFAPPSRMFLGDRLHDF